MSLANKIAIITGASQGFGFAIAKEFIKKRATVVIVNRTEVTGKEAANRLTERGGRVLAIPCDTTNLEQVEKMVSKVENKFGKIDILVNNAGIIKPAMLHKMSVGQWEEVIRVNLTGYFIVLREVSKVMIPQKYGRIVNISSVAGSRGTIGQINYGSAKAGVHGLTKSAAKELARYNITVNAIAAGLFKTPMTDKMPLDIKERSINEIPLKRMGEPWELARLTAYLVSEDAGYITGQIIGINGGIYM